MCNLENKNEQNKLKYREQINGCQIGRGLRGWVKKAKEISINWQLQNRGI